MKRIVGGFRRDARLAFSYEKRRRSWKIEAPIINIVSVDDALTANYRSRYRRWEALSTCVRLYILQRGRHYFIGQEADQVAQVVCHAHEGYEAVLARRQPIIEWSPQPKG